MAAVPAAFLAVALLAAHAPARADAGAAHAEPPLPCCGDDSTRAAEPGPDSGAELIGQPMRDFRFDRWLRGGPLTPESLRGKVVLMRFWTDDCSYCEHTLPAIERLRKRYAEGGLVVMGAYHPHEPHAVTDAHVAKWAKKYGFGGPVAVDAKWETLEHWWLDGHPERNWVSVSFLMDRDGVVRWVHGGGEYHPNTDLRHKRCDRQYAELEAVIREQLGVTRAAR